VQEYRDISSFRNAARRDAAALENVTLFLREPLVTGSPGVCAQQSLRSMAVAMETVDKLKHLISFYLMVLVFLLLCVIATPMVIRHGLPLTRELIIAEDTFETILIVILLAVSFFILRGFQRALKAYGRLADRQVRVKSRLVSRLAEAFSYIGTVNVEIQEIHSILGGVEHYPQTHKELKQLLDRLASKAMAVAGAPWIVVRMLSRCSGRTVKEYAIERQSGMLPAATIGNRAILEGHNVEGLLTIGSRQRNLDLMTVCILPKTPLSEEDIVLVSAILNQIEMFYLLYCTGCTQVPETTRNFQQPLRKGITP
jgi:hypothetical protein